MDKIFSWATTNWEHIVVIGLGNVDNTADADKPISTATQTALNGKQATGAYLINENDPTYTASNAAGISAANISTWNAKAGTVAPTFTGNVTISNNCVFSTANATHVPCYKSSTKILGSCLALNATNGVCTNCRQEDK